MFIAKKLKTLKELVRVKERAITKDIRRESFRGRLSLKQTKSLREREGGGERQTDRENKTNYRKELYTQSQATHKLFQIT